MAGQSDEELVYLVRMGDRTTFDRLIERYQDQMERVARRLVGAPEAAQDIVQEAMLQAYLSLDDLRSAASFHSWLTSIVLNLGKGYLRAQKRETRFGMPIEPNLSENIWYTNSVARDPQQVALERELHRTVLQAVEELPSAHRETTRMYYYESLTLQEIVTLTGASPEAIKVRLHRARNHLRQKLRGAYPEMGMRRTQTNRRSIMVKVEIIDVIKRDEKYIVILKDSGRDRYLPIWIGPPEGKSIAMGLRAFPTHRPMTYEFIARLLETLGAQLEAVQVEALKQTTFFGIAKVRIGNEVKHVDARPSDVIALAVRTGSPIFVSEPVLEAAGINRVALEADFGEIVPGEGMDEIVSEFEELFKQFSVSPPEDDE